MKLKLLTVCLALVAFGSAQADTVEPDGDHLLIRCDGNGCKKKEVFYVNFPADVVSPPNNGAYSGASITKDFIFLSGVTGQYTNGDPAPLGPNGITQITQAYTNLVNILNYLQIPVTDVVKLDVLIEAQDQYTFQTYRSTANQVQSTIWQVQPPRTITGVNTLNLGVLEVTATVKNTKKTKVVQNN